MTNEDWIEHFDTAQLLNISKEIIDVVQNLTGQNPSGYGAALKLSMLGHHLTYLTRDWKIDEG